MGICHRDYAPSLGPVDGPDVDDGSREELAEYAASLCSSCVRHGRDCPLDPTGIVLDCVEYQPKEEPCPIPQSGWTTTTDSGSTMTTSSPPPIWNSPSGRTNE